MRNAVQSRPEIELAEIARSVAFDVPKLNELSQEQIRLVAEMVIVERYKRDLDKEVEMSKYDFQTMKSLFLSMYESENTKSAYGFSLKQFGDWCAASGLNPLAASAANIDDFVYGQVKSGKSSATVRRNVRALSSFFSFCERRSNGAMKNVVRGTRAAPKDRAAKKNKFYSFGGVDKNTLDKVGNDFQTIIDSVDNRELKAIIYIAINCGLRVGAFSGLSIHGNRYRTVSKGKEITGHIADDVVGFLDTCGISHKLPFARYTDARLKNLFKYHTNKLRRQGVISYNYSFHDLRHYFALRGYSEHKDLYRLSKELNHTSIAITEKYLKGLKVVS